MAEKYLWYFPLRSCGLKVGADRCVYWRRDFGDAAGIEYTLVTKAGRREEDVDGEEKY